ncbi:uncharacterized protein LOC132062068 [Lycium ferocissimum]|uniref:uncharacterized protein LOC132062068 n=1 Tax=Lycium ferocissimum TaxID=112874 RepID=UPI00281650A2|nr:uncharacterized protein LOC132062068 [Lycium ferocissimum]
MHVPNILQSDESFFLVPNFVNEVGTDAHVPNVLQNDESLFLVPNFVTEVGTDCSDTEDDNGKCKRAKREVLETLEGSFTDNYKKLEAYANELRESNPGSDVVINLSKEALAQGKRKFLRMYICFKALKMGFKEGLRPFIGLDGTFLKGKAKGQVLVAIGQDSMNQFYPLAWAVVDKETKRTWSWMLDAIKNVLCLLKHIRYFMSSTLRQIGAKGGVKMKQLDEPVAKDLISRYPPETWCRAYLDTVSRYKPIIGMLDDIRIKVMNRLRENDEFVNKWYGLVSPNIMKLYNEYLKIAQVCKVNDNGDSGYEVTEGHDRHVVNLRQKRCTCRTWDLTGIPCPHAIKAMIHKKIDPISEIHWYHSKEAFKLAYKHKLQPVRGVQFWNVDPSQAMEPPTLVKLAGRPRIKRDIGKDEALKRQSEWKLSRKGRVMTCSNCGEPNHNVRGCGKVN